MPLPDELTPEEAIILVSGLGFEEGDRTSEFVLFDYPLIFGPSITISLEENYPTERLIARLARFSISRDDIEYEWDQYTEPPT